MSVKLKTSIWDIRKLIITKRLNLLIGSGASVPAIKLMAQCKGETQEEKNKDLMNNVKKVSSELICDSNSKEAKDVLENYTAFLKLILEMLEKSNAREVPKSANLFTTNYDLFVEKSIDLLSLTHRFFFNDGTSGYFKHYLDSSNYNKAVSYRGINDNYNEEIVTLNLIKPHGSMM